MKKYISPNIQINALYQDVICTSVKEKPIEFAWDDILLG